MFRRILFSLYLFAALAGAQLLPAQTKLWTGAQSAQWNNPNNWNPTGVPGPGDQVVVDVPGEGTVIYQGVNSTIASLVSQEPLIISNATLTVSGTVQVNNVLTLTDSTLKGATVLSAPSAIVVPQFQAATLDGVTLNRNLTLNNGARLTVLNGLTLNAAIALESTGNSTRVEFSGTQSLLGTGEVIFNGTFGNRSLQPTSGTLTIGPGITVRGNSGTIGNASLAFINQGKILSGNTNQTLILTGAGWSNTGILEAGNEGILDLRGSWSNTGTIVVNGGTLQLGGAFTTAAIGTINRTGGEIQIDGDLDNSGATLTLNAATGDWALVTGGEIIGGTVAGGPIGRLIIPPFNTGRLNGATINGVLRLDNGARAIALNGLTLNGTINLESTGNYTPLEFSGTQSLLGTGEVIFNGPFANRALLPTSGTLTIGPGITIRGNSGTIGNAQLAFINQGKILAGTTNQTLILTGTAWSNSGILEAGNGGILDLRGSWSNTGTMVVNGGTLQLGGNFTTAGIGTINRTGGEIQIDGDLDNSGATLTLNAATGDWQLVTGGEIIGGTVAAGTGGRLIIPPFNTGRLNGVTINGALRLDNGARPTAVNGLTLNGTISLESTGNYTALEFSGTQSFLGTGEVIFNGPFANRALLPTSGTLTIGPGITVRGNSGTIGNAQLAFINQGKILAGTTNQTLILTGTAWSNSGILEASNEGILELRGNWSNSGTMVVNGGTLQLGGAFQTARIGTINRTGGEIQINGDLDNNGATLTLNAATGEWQLVTGGEIIGGTVAAGTGGGLIVPPFNAARLNGVTINGALRVQNGARVTAVNGLTLNGTISLESTGNYTPLEFSGTQSLLGTGEVIFNGPFANRAVLPTSGTLTIGPGITVRGNSGTIGNAQLAFINQGKILAGNTNQTLILTGAGWSNSGILEASNEGILDLRGSWSNTGTMVVNGGTLQLGGAFKTAGIGTINRTGGEIQIDGELDNNGATLTLNATTGDWQLVTGGEIIGGTVAAGTGGGLIVPPFNAARLNGVTINGALRVQNGARVTAVNGLTLNGMISLESTGNYTPLEFSGTQSFLGSGEVIFNGPFANRALLPTSGTLTIGPGITIRGNSGTIGNAQLAFINQGKILAATTNQTLILTGTGWSNSGILEAGNEGTLDLRGSWSNTGTMVVNGGTLKLGGTFKTTGIGTINRIAGEIQMNGDLDNNGATLTINAATGDWVLLNGSAIIGGIVVAGGGGELVVEAFNTGTLNDVTVNGALRLENGSRLSVMNGLTLHGTITLDSTGNYTALEFNGAQSLLGSGEIIFNGPFANRAVLPVSGTLTIGPGITIRGGGGTVGNLQLPLINEGRIVAGTSNRVVTVVGSALSNRGRVQAESGGELLFRGAITNAGEIVANPGLLTITGSLVQSPLGVLTIPLGGVTPQTGAGQINISQSAILDGLLNITLANGFIPAITSRFEVLKFPTGSGAFANLVGEAPYFTPQYSPSNVVLLTQAIPSNGQAPLLQTQPQSQSVTLGAPAVLTVTAAGTPTLSYQWRLNGAIIPGATSAAYPIPSFDFADAGVYRVTVANALGVVDSSDATLTPNIPPLTMANDFSARISVTDLARIGLSSNLGATREPGEPNHAGKVGGASVWITWIAPATGIVEFTTLGSSFDTLLAVYTGSSVSALNPVASDDDSGGFFTSRLSFNATAGTAYQVAVDGLAGATGSIVLGWTLFPTLETIPVILTQPANQSVPANTTATFTVVAQSAGPLQYQWFFENAPLPNATTPTLTLSNVTSSSVGGYKVQVRNSTQSVFSRTAVLEVGPAPGGTSEDKFEDLFAPNEGAGAALQGTPRRKSGFVSVTAGTLGTQLLDNLGATTQSGEPNHGGVIGGASRWLRLVPESDGTMMVDTVGSAIDTVLAVYRGRNLNNLTLVTSDNNGAPDGVRSLARFSAQRSTDYLVAVDGVKGAQGHLQVNWRLGTPPVIREQPTNQTVSAGASVSFVVVASGVPAPQYQWRFRGTNLAGATDAVLQLNNVQAANAGNYTVVVSNFAGDVTSAPARLTVTAGGDLRFSSSSVLGNGNVRFSLTGPLGAAAVIQSSADLLTWVPLSTNTLGGSALDLTLTPTNRMQFYRAILR